MASDAEVAMQAAFLMAGIGGLCGVGMLLSAIRKRREDRYARDSFAPVEAKVRKSEQVESTGYDEDDNPVHRTSYLVTYEYVVDGRTHIGRAGFNNHPYGSVRVYYDRNDPDISHGKMPVSAGGNGGFVISAFLFVFAALFLGAGLLAMRQIG